MPSLTVWPPLPRRTRMRLWLTARADDAAYWLVCRYRISLAIGLYRACGMWH